MAHRVDSLKRATSIGGITFSDEGSRENARRAAFVMGGVRAATTRLSGGGQPEQLGTAGSLPVQLLGVLPLIGEVVTVTVPSLR